MSKPRRSHPMTLADALSALPAHLKELTPERARAALADGSVTADDIRAAMTYHSSLLQALPTDCAEYVEQLNWSARLAILAAPYFHEEVPAISMDTFKRDVGP